MKKYSAQTNHWRESKALGFFLNFINNHKGTVNDDDVFALVASLRSKEEWIDFVRAAFSEQTITQMEESRDRMNRLDFDDECKEIIRNIWNAPYAQNRLRKELTKVANRMGEEARVAIRAVRREANDAVKALEKDGSISEDDCTRALKDIQDYTDTYVKKVDDAVAAKEKDIMAV